ncbi:MAG: hypothetical protein ABIP11_02310 [Luteimonas sp.]
MHAQAAQQVTEFHRYREVSRHPGVVAYALLPEAIAVEFDQGGVYVYSHDCPGRRHVSRMKLLAEQGHGLSSYINRHIRNRFAAHFDSPQAVQLQGQSSTRQNAALR